MEVSVAIINNNLAIILLIYNFLDMTVIPETSLAGPCQIVSLLLMIGSAPVEQYLI